jgi:hypothetical protein
VVVRDAKATEYRAKAAKTTDKLKAKYSEPFVVMWLMILGGEVKSSLLCEVIEAAMNITKAARSSPPVF